MSEYVYDTDGHPTAESLLRAWLEWLDMGQQLSRAPAGMTRLYLARAHDMPDRLVDLGRAR